MKVSMVLVKGKIVFTLLLVLLGLLIGCNCPTSSKQEAAPAPAAEAPAKPAEKPATKADAAPVDAELLKACKAFEPPWGTQDWSQWWTENPDAGEAWFAEASKKGKELDFKLLARCTHLDNIFLGWSELEDLSVLAPLVNTKRLDLRFSGKIKDLTPLQALTNLEYLNIWGAAVTDLSPLIPLAKLREVNARMIPLTDLSPVPKMPAIEILDLLRTPVVDISPLAANPRIKQIMTCSTQVKDLSPLYPVVDRITYLDLCNVPFRDFKELTRFKNLTVLKLWGLPIGDLGILSGMTKMEELDLSGATFTSLKPLLAMKHLKKLDLINTKIKDAELAELKKALPELKATTELD